MNNFRRKVEQYIKVHKTLHGRGFDKKFVIEDLYNSFGYSREKVLKK